MKRQKRIWVVEVKFYGTRKWETTLACGLDKAHAIAKSKEWTRHSSHDKVRVRKYVKRR